MIYSLDPKINAEVVTIKCKHKLKRLSEGYTRPGGYVSPIFQCSKCLKVFKLDRYDDVVEASVE